jgi:hypothetical protein
LLSLGPGPYRQLLSCIPHPALQPLHDSV